MKSKGTPPIAIVVVSSTIVALSLNRLRVVSDVPSLWIVSKANNSSPDGFLLWKMSPPKIRESGGFLFTILIRVFTCASKNPGM